jgi:hypothetical protein
VTAFSAQVAPTVTAFYGGLDTVRFADDIASETRKARAMTVTGELMMDMIVGKIAPFLSQAQSYDNRLILDLITPHDDPKHSNDRLAILHLARAGFIHVAMMDRAPANPRAGSDRYTLINLLRASLANPEFVLSGWPELNDNLDLRGEVLDCLDHAPDGRMSSAVPPNIAARVEGLREFDWNLRQSPSGIGIVQPPGGDPLGIRIQASLYARPQGEAIRNAGIALFAEAGRRSMNLNSRSGWYRLLFMAAQAGDTETETLSSLREIVDLDYNWMVGQSLKPGGMSLASGDQSAADAAADRMSLGQPLGREWADLMPASDKGDWLHWADLPQILSEIDVLDSHQQRIAELKRRRENWLAEYAMENSWGLALRIALPTAVASALIPSVPISLLTSATATQAAISASLTGITTLIAGTPAVRAAQRWNTGRALQRLTSHDERSVIRTGAAGWLDRIRGRE